MVSGSSSDHNGGGNQSRSPLVRPNKARNIAAQPIQTSSESEERNDNRSQASSGQTIINTVIPPRTAASIIDTSETRDESQRIEFGKRGSLLMSQGAASTPSVQPQEYSRPALSHLNNLRGQYISPQYLALSYW